MSIFNRCTVQRIALGVFLAASFVSAASVQAQRRDFMTDAEIEIVRDAQDIDVRIDVLTKMIDRRFAALKIDSAGWKPPAKASDKWGEEPTGTRLQLLTDVRRLLQKAVDDIDDVAEHDANALAQNKMSGKLFPKAVRNLSSAADRYSRILKPLAEAASDDQERGVILTSIDLCSQITEAAAKLPAEIKDKKKS